jgi:hypothetical protein
MTERDYHPLVPIGEPSVLPPILEPSLVPIEPAEFALTQKQRLAILDRDNNRCRATVPHHHASKKYPLEVDHIVPQRYGTALGIDQETLDQPNNLLTKCRNAHDLKHRDRITARDDWRESHNGSFIKMFNERGELLKHGEIYWNPDYDRTDMVQAMKLTQEAQKRGWIFPEKRKIM